MFAFDIFFIDNTVFYDSYTVIRARVFIAYLYPAPFAFWYSITITVVKFTWRLSRTKYCHSVLDPTLYNFKFTFVYVILFFQYVILEYLKGTSILRRAFSLSCNFYVIFLYRELLKMKRFCSTIWKQR